MRRWFAQCFQLLSKRTLCPVEHDARRRFQQHAFSFAQLIGIQNRNAAAPVKPILTVHVNKHVVELLTQFLTVRRPLLIENDQVNLDVPITPVRVRLERLLHQHQVF